MYLVNGSSELKSVHMVSKIKESLCWIIEFHAPKHISVLLPKFNSVFMLVAKVLLSVWRCY